MEPTILHVGSSKYASLEDAGHTLRIWRELAQGAREYHVLARNAALRFRSDHSENLHLHLVPGVPSKLYPALAYHAFVIARRHRPDVILCQDPLIGGWAALRAGRTVGAPVLMEVHTDLHFRNFSSRRPSQAALGRLAARALRRSAAVRVLSPNLAEQLVRMGVPSERLVYLPNRVDLGRFSPGDERRRRGRSSLGVFGGAFVVTSVGRFVEQKGYAGLIAAFAKVLARNPQARLVLIGGGPLDGEYREAAAQAGVSHAMRLVAWCDQEALVDLLAASDLYVQPSVPGKGEAMPRAILEAMAMQLAVVATRVAGIPGVIEDGRNGRLVEPGDQEALADTIVAVLDDDRTRQNLAQHGRDDAMSMYEWGANFARFRETLHELAARGQRRG